MDEQMSTSRRTETNREDTNSRRGGTEIVKDTDILLRKHTEKTLKLISEGAAAGVLHRPRLQDIRPLIHCQKDYLRVQTYDT